MSLYIKSSNRNVKKETTFKRRIKRFTINNADRINESRNFQESIRNEIITKIFNRF